LESRSAILSERDAQARERVELGSPPPLPHPPRASIEPRRPPPPQNTTDAPPKRARDTEEDVAADQDTKPAKAADAAAADAKRARAADADADADAEPDQAPPLALSAAAAAALAAAAKSPSAIFRPDLLTDASRAQAAASFASAQPFPHLVLRDLLGDQGALLRAVREELVTHVRATYKETDLFRVFQTGDLANLDALDEEQRAKLPALSALRAALYSEPFRAFVRAATGCGELDGHKTDLSCNVYAPGGHLLCHDDVIGSRRVSFIVYLTDPDEPWDAAADGGALELYPLLQQAAGDGASGDTGALPPPSVEPSALLPPYWNSMAMFVVTPGVSYHAVQEVTAPQGKPRLSISGWYHAPAPPPGAESTASLAQLKLAPGADAVREHAAFVEEEGEKKAAAAAAAASAAAEAAASAAATAATARDPDEKDLALLARYVAPAYLEPRAWDAVRRKFEADGSVQLHGFLSPGIARAVVRAARSADAAAGLGRGKLPADYLVGAREGRDAESWEPVGPPHKQRYLRFRGEAAEDALEKVGGEGRGEAADADAGALLAALRRDLFSTGAFARLLRRLTSVQMLGHSGEVRRFRPGLDYTVAHYGVLTSDPRLDCVLCFVDDGKDAAAAGAGGAAGPSNGSAANNDPSAAAEAWADGEVGGYEAYVLGDDDDEEAGKAGAKKGAAEVYRAVGFASDLPTPSFGALFGSKGARQPTHNHN
jgi:Rps23 Pro-64 3,4-dihydroxylase Tpa1-like proline 4-hydroxylase